MDDNLMKYKLPWYILSVVSILLGGFNLFLFGTQISDKSWVVINLLVGLFCIIVGVKLFYEVGRYDG